MPPNSIAEVAIRHRRQVVSKIVIRRRKDIECGAKGNASDQQLTCFLHGFTHDR
jgi:hypothetical protein